LTDVRTVADDNREAQYQVDYQVQNIVGSNCYYENSCVSNLKAIPDGQNGTTSKLGFPFLTNDGLIKVKIPLRAYDKDGNVVKYTE
jgi:hypothetical protein